MHFRILHMHSTPLDLRPDAGCFIAAGSAGLDASACNVAHPKGGALLADSRQQVLTVRLKFADVTVCWKCCDAQADIL